MEQNVYALSQEQIETQTRSLVQRVYVWMFAALMLTGVVALVTASTSLWQSIFNSPMFIVLILAELGLVWILSLAIHRMSPAVAAVMFFVYSALNGLTLSVVFLAYTSESVAMTFFASAGSFGAMAIYGHTTQRDLTSIGNLCMMALFGIIIASLINIFMASSALYWAITYIGVLVFVGLTAYDAQKIKVLGQQYDLSSADGRRIAVLGALELYLDFINLFLLLLRLLGRRR